MAPSYSRRKGGAEEGNRYLPQAKHVLNTAVSIARVTKFTCHKFVLSYGGLMVPSSGQLVLCSRHYQLYLWFGLQLAIPQRLEGQNQALGINPPARAVPRWDSHHCPLNLTAAFSMDGGKCGEELSTQAGPGALLPAEVGGRSLGVVSSIVAPISVPERFSNLPTSHGLSAAEPGLKPRPPGFTV